MLRSSVTATSEPRSNHQLESYKQVVARFIPVIDAGTGKFRVFFILYTNHCSVRRPDD